jgi:hypothetical protein
MALSEQVTLKMGGSYGEIEIRAMVRAPLYSAVREGVDPAG